MYNYKTQKPNIFTEDGQRMFLNIRDRSKELLGESGAFMLDNVIAGCGGGDSWNMLACVDRLLELGEIREIEQVDVPGQYRVFVAASR